MSDFVTLPAISLWQPWASLLFPRIGYREGERPKVHETRSWPAPAKHIGQPIVIHAAKKYVRFHDLPRALRDLCVYEWTDDYDSLPRGVAIGTAVLASSDVMSRIQPAHDEDLVCGDWSPERFAWRMESPIPFPEPIPMIGRQGFFKAEISAELLTDRKAA